MDLTYWQLTENTILIQWPLVVDRKTLEEIIKVKRLWSDQKLYRLRDIYKAYTELSLVFEGAAPSVDTVREMTVDYMTEEVRIEDLEFSNHEIPVRYNLVGEDMMHICKSKNLLPEQVVALHTSVLYDVHFVGFLPGFLYLGNLPESLHVDRKSTPSRRIKKGSVAIGGSQTGIYPMDSPGGWWIIGRTNKVLFDPEEEPPMLIREGDYVTFVDVSQEERL